MDIASVSQACPELAERVSLEHLSFIRANGDRHITQKSFDHYKAGGSETDVLLEYRAKGELVGLSFTACPNGHSEHSITVVRRDFRNRGIGAALLKAKKELAADKGCQLCSLVAQSNTPSVRMCSKVFTAWEALDGRYLFYDGGAPCAE
jgi:GNAT superfamily N-acetyltransferase